MVTAIPREGIPVAFSVAFCLYRCGGVSRGLLRLVVGLVLMPALTEAPLAQTQSSVEPARTASSELPAITVESSAQSPKPRPLSKRNARRAARPFQHKPESDPATMPAATAPGAPNVASGPVGQPNMASQITVAGEALNARPVARPGEILEAVPGLLVTQHSGEGKANQYFLRGYNLDHGTDMAIYVDDVPVNMRTHAHGQGYADLNWLMPETINALDVRKGPYFADEGDFSSVGNLHISLIDRLDKGLAQMTVGSFGYRRSFGMGSTRVGDGTLLVASEAGSYNGPWNNPDEMRKLNGLVRYSQGTALAGFSITGMGYTNGWNSTDQVPLRAIASGDIGRFGTIDSTDGGNSNRFALSTRIAGSDDSGSWKANAYAVKSTLDLYNNFTYFLGNPELGDQFRQRDERVMAGANASRTLNGSFAGRPVETTFGIQTRYDAIDLALTDTYRRSFLANVRSDRVGEGSVGIYAQNTVHWADWLRTTLGWRADYYDAQVTSLFDPNNSGHVNAAIGSPKFTMVLGPFNKTEFFLGAGYGMHSNDARGATITEAPGDPDTKLSASPLLVRTRGAEVGVRSKIVPGLNSSLSLFALDQDSEIVFSGDAGDTSASRASRRYGVEWTNHFQPLPWIAFEADIAVTHSRFVGYDSEQAAVYDSLSGYPLAQIGNAPGNYIPNAPAAVASASITLGEKTGWFGTLRWRYLGSSPLTEDNAFRSQPISVVNGRIGYRAENGWRVQFDALNLFNARTSQISYAYGSLIRSDSYYNLCYPVQAAPAAVCQNGVMDSVLHPIEPLAVRMTLAGSF
jgi:outer membrane receptor protein involved in Fe transport